MISLISALLLLASQIAVPVQTETQIYPASNQADGVIRAEDTEVAPLAQPQAVTRYAGVKLRGIDKITARSLDFEAPIGSVTRFGNLEVVPRSCWVSPAESLQEEQAALVEIWYWKTGEKPSLAFYGWMFASSPSISSLEHPVYDVTMLECLQTVEAEAEQP